MNLNYLKPKLKQFFFQEYTGKLQKIKEVEAEVKNHLENLPDIINLPDVTGGLAALPSAADLFNVHH